MRIAITGASGLIGTAAVHRLRASGHQITALVRGTPKPGEIRWNPTGSVDLSALSGHDAVVHLAGESISGRWTAAKKSKILNSRVQGTMTVAAAIARLQQKPKVLVSASAVGYYGASEDKSFDESSPPGADFLAEVAKQWESATEAAARAGIRVVLLRFGVVLSGAGGALKQMLPPFRMGVGGRLGSGKQWMSWVSVEDAAGAVEVALANPAVSGAVNVVSPNPVTNAEFTNTLGAVLHRPTVLPMPGFAVKLAFGEMGETLLLRGQRVLPKKLQENGYTFIHGNLKDALTAAVG